MASPALRDSPVSMSMTSSSPTMKVKLLMTGEPTGVVQVCV